MIKAKKRFGQNFLKDESIKEKIIQSMPNDKLHIIEIGPGLGDLTKELLAYNKKVTAFEIDLGLCSFLQSSFKDELKSSKLDLVCGDVLKSWESSLIEEDYHLIANLPYNIATNIILRALNDKKCRSILVMIQKEVALKFSAKSGDKAFSSLSILTNLIAESKLLFDVKPECFEPQPKVTSAVIKIVKTKDYIEDSLFNEQLEFKKFKIFLKAAFVAPRKTLIKNLQKYYTKEALLKEFEKFELSLNIRPHQLKTKEYHLLFKNLK